MQNRGKGIIDIKGTWLTKNCKIDTEDVRLKKYKIDKKGKIERCKIDTKSIYTKIIYIDKVGSNKFQKWQFRFRIDNKVSKLTNVLKAEI